MYDFTLPNCKVSEADLKELIGVEKIVRLAIDFDVAGRRFLFIFAHLSNGKCDVVFINEEFARETQNTFHGELLDGRELQFEVKGPYQKPQRVNKGKKGIQSRLGPSLDSRLGRAPGNILSRLGARVEDRLGKKLDDRLGKKKMKLTKKNLKEMDVDIVPTGRAIKSYADTHVTEDGNL
jgi:hypothetical protein